MTQIVLDWARGHYRRLRRMKEHAFNRQQTPEQVFSRIYRNGLWGKSDGEFCSGSGSSEAHAIEYVKALARYVEQHSVRSVVDLGCGDFVVGRKIAALGVDYTGVDVVPELIRHNTERYGSPRVRFAHLDIIDDELPGGDLCLIRQVLQHLSNDQIAKAMRQLARYEHVIVTEHFPGPGAQVVPNKDKPHGHDTRIEDDSAVFLDRAPFNFRIDAELLALETRPLKRPGEMLRTFRVMPG
jgi:SAM-dependent methyltransferase